MHTRNCYQQVKPTKPPAGRIRENARSARRATKRNHIISFPFFFLIHVISEKRGLRCSRTIRGRGRRHQPQALPRRPRGRGSGVSRRRRGELGGRAEVVGRGERRGKHWRRPRGRAAVVVTIVGADSSTTAGSSGGGSVRRRREQHRAVLAAAGADRHVADGAAGRPVAVAGPAEVARLVHVVVVEVAELGVPAQAARARQPRLGRRRARPSHLLQQVGAAAAAAAAPAPRRRRRGARVAHGLRLLLLLIMRGDDLAEQLDARRPGGRHLDVRRQHVARGQRRWLVDGSMVSEGAITY
jgi:hypothetical protein